MSEHSDLDFAAKVMLDPEDRGTLSATEQGLQSNTGKIYPNFMQIPFVFRHVEQHLRQWEQKIASVAHYYREQRHRAEQALARIDLLPTTRLRLQNMISAYQKSQSFFEDVQKQIPLATAADSAKSDFFFERIPRQQTVMAYYQTAFRDWVWGESEIERQVQIVQPHIQGRQRLLTLGAGACGLPVRLHEAIPDLTQLAVDINPVLFHFAQSVFAAKSFAAVEYPALPKSLAQTAMVHQVKPRTKPKGFHMLLADAQDLGFVKGTFDTILTPWFVDIVPRDYRELARQFNQHLEIGGIWVQVGPLAFERLQPGEVYSADEIREILEESGFRVHSAKSHSIPYLCSPSSCLKREDEVFLFVAEKVKAAKKPAQYKYLPEWLVDWSLPIPQDRSIISLAVKSQIYAQVLSCVDGQTNMQQIAERFAQHHKLPLDSARSSLGHFFTNVFENNIFREF